MKDYEFVGGPKDGDIIRLDKPVLLLMIPVKVDINLTTEFPIKPTKFRTANYEYKEGKYHFVGEQRE